MPGKKTFCAAAVITVLQVVCQVVKVTEGRWTKRDRDAQRLEEQRQQQELLEKTVAAVELGLSFFSQDYSAINLDGLFGMRLGQGQVIRAIQECRESSSCPSSLQRRLVAINERIETTGRAALAYVKDSDPDYYNRFIKTINSSYLLQYNPVTLTDLHLIPPGNDASYDEERGDQCLSRIMGTYVDDNKEKVAACSVTKSCLDMMTAWGRSKYSITHQLLYFIVVEKEHCVEETERLLGAKISAIEQKMCGSIYNEAVAEVIEGKVDQMGQDLFLEQVVLCGSIGVENFMRPDWIKMILKWQKSGGCFSLDDPGLMAIEEQLSLIQEKQRTLMKDLKEEAQMIEQQDKNRHWRGRKLLREHVMQDGCLSHKTGLGFGTFCLFTRYLVRQNYLQN